MVRVLFVLADTDRSDRNAAALGLHRDLVRNGLEMRSVALGPGRTGGLENVVPMLSPGARSLSAVTQLRREQRWADVLVCWDLGVSLIQRLGGSRRRPPKVIVPAPIGSARGPLVSFARRGAIEGPVGEDASQWHDFLVSAVAPPVGPP